MLFVGFVNLFAKILKSNAFVARILLTELWEDFPHWHVLVIVVLELLQGAEQRVPSTFGNSDRKHDKERVEACFLNDNAMLHEVTRHDRSWNTRVGKVACHIQARSDDGRLDRIKHIKSRGQFPESVPSVVRHKHPIVSFADSFVGQMIGPPDLEPPIGSPFVVHLAHGAAKIDGFHNGLFHQCGPARRFHHGGRHVA